MNNHIEEMAKIIAQSVDEETLCDGLAGDSSMACFGCDYSEKEYCKHHIESATGLYNKGYRKSTDVAREIFAEIVKFIFSEIPDELMPIYKAEKDFRDGVVSGKREAFFKVLTHLDNHLRKKYESDGEDDV